MNVFIALKGSHFWFYISLDEHILDQQGLRIDGRQLMWRGR